MTTKKSPKKKTAKKLSGAALAKKDAARAMKKPAKKWSASFMAWKKFAASAGLIVIRGKGVAGTAAVHTHSPVRFAISRETSTSR